MAGNNDFSINIQIGLQDEGKQLLTQWNKIKQQVEKEGLNIKFGNDINESIKQITLMSTQITNLTKQIESLSGTGKNVELINTNNLKYEIKGALTSLEEVKKVIKELGINNVVDINVSGIDKSTQEITKFVVKVKEAEGIIKDFQFNANRVDSGSIGEMSVAGYEGAVSKIKDSTNKILEQIDKFKSEYQTKINSIKDIGLVDNNKTNEFEKSLNSLNVNNFKSSIDNIKNNFKDLQVESNNLIKQQEELAKETEKANQQTQDAISKTNKAMQEESKLLEQNQAKSSNKALDQNYNDIQKFVSQSESQITKLEEKFKGLYSNLDFSKIRSEMDNLLPNDSELNTKFSAITSKIQQLSTELTEKQRLNNLGENVGSFSSTGLSMSSSLQDIQKYIQSLSGTKASVSSVSESIDSMGNKIRTANVSVNEGNNIYSKYKLNLDDISQSAYKTAESVQNLSSKHGNFIDQITNAVSGMTMWATSAGLLFGSLEQLKQGVDTVIEMNTALTTLGITMNASGGQLQDMSQQIQQTAIQLGTSVDRVTQAVKTYANASESVSTIMGKVKPDVMLANVTGLDAKETTDAIHGIINQYNLAGEDAEKTATHISDSLITIGKNLALDFGQSINDISKGIEQVGSVANETGKQSFEQTSSMIGAIEEKTRISGSQIANGLKTIMARVYQSKSIDPDVSDEDMSKASAMFTQLGVNIRDDATGSYRNFTDIVKDLNKAMSGMTDSQKQAILIQGAGVRQANIFQAAIDTIGKTEILTTKAINSNGEAVNANAQYLNSVQGRLQVLKSTLSSMWLNTINSNAIGTLVSDTTKLVSTFGNLHTVLTLVGTSIAVFKGTEILNFFKTLPSLVNISNLQMVRYQATLAGLTAEEIANMTTTQGLKFAWAGLTSTMAMNPIGAIALGISAVVLAMDAFGKSTQDQINKMDEMSQKVQQEQSDISSLQSNLTTLDELHSKTSLTNDDKTKLASINNDLASKYPELISYYDKESKSFQISTQELEKLIKKKQELAMEENASNLNDAKEQADKAQKAIDEANAQLKSGKKTVTVKSEFGYVDNVEKDLSDADKQKLTKTISDNETLLEKTNPIINQATKYINDYVSEEEKLGKSQDEINQGLKQYGYSQNQIDDAIAKSVNTTSQSSGAIQNNTNKTKDNTKAKQDNANVDTTNGMKSLSQIETNFAKSLGDVRKEITPINQALKDHAENGQWDMDTILKLAESYPDLLTKLGDDAALEKELIKIKNDKMQATKDELKTEIDTLTKKISSYGIDVSKYQTAEEMKTAILKTQVAERLNALKKEMDEMDLENYKKKHPELTAQEAENNFAKGQMRTGDLYGDEYNKVLSPVDSLFKAKDLEKQFDTAINQVSDDLKKNSSSTKENKVAQDALADAIKSVSNEMKSYENAIKAVDNALYALDSQMQGMDQTSDKYINSLKAENELYQERISLVNSAKDANNSYIGSIASMGGVSGTAMGQQVIAKAETFLNTPYLWGSNNPANGGMDCSGLVQYIFKQFGIELGRTTYDQIKDGKAVNSKQELQPGDIVFFGNPSAPGHEGMYIGNDQFIEAPHSNANIRVSNLSSRSDYAGARRVISDSDSSSSTTTTSSSSTSITASQLDSVLKGALSGMGEAFIKYGQEYGVDPALAASITMHESGNGTSYAVRNQNNPAGIMDWDNNWQTVRNFSSLDEGIQYAIKNLKQQYLDQGLTTISQIGGKYAPVGASNDPNGLNKDWIPGVSAFYKQITGKTGSVDTVDLANSANSQIESILSKNEDYTKQNIDYAKKIQENNDKIYQAYLGRYDEQLSHVDRNKDMAQTMYNLYKDNQSLDGMTKASQYKEQVYKEINQHYGVLNQKEQFITSQLYNDNLSEKQRAEALQSLEEVRIEKQKIISDLHTEFQSWQESLYNASIKTNQTNIDTLQRKYDILDKSSTKNYADKINLNNEILSQEQEIYKTTVDRIDALQKLISTEKDDNSRQVWIDEQTKLLQQLDEIKSKTIEIQQKNIQLAENNALDDVEKAIYGGQTQTQYEDSINARTTAIDDQLKSMQKQTEQLQEQETRQKNLLSLAEAQIKLQDAQNEKSVQQLTKDKNGNWNFQYVANQQNVDDLEKSMRDQVVSNRDWERDTTQKHLEESLNDEKDLLNEEVSIRSEAYSRIKENLEKAIEDNKDEIIDGTVTISSLINTSLNGINTKYNGKYSSIITDLKSFIGNYTASLTTFNTTLQNSLSSINSISNTSLNPGTNSTVWVTDLASKDAQTAKQYYSSLGYAIKQLDTATAKNVASGDILLGAAGTYYTNNVSSTLPSGVTKLTGATSADTIALAQADSYQKEQQAIANAKIQVQQATIQINANGVTTSTYSSGGTTYSTQQQSSTTGVNTTSNGTEHIDSTSTNSSGASVTSMIGQGGGYVKVTYSDGSSKTIKQYDTGGYTGDWNSSEGRLAVLHEKELVLNKNQTQDILNTVSILDKLNLPSIQDMISKLPNISSILPKISMPDISGIISKASQTISNTVNLSSLTLSCPNVVDGNSLMEVIQNLPNTITQTSNSNL